MSEITKRVICLADFVLFLCLLYWSPFNSDPIINKALSLLVFIGILWLSEAIHISIVALLIPIFAVVLGLMNTKNALIAFADPNIFLFLGGFALAAAMRVQKIDEWIAQKIILLARGHFGRSIFAIFLVTACLSMWMSNTAVVVIVLPLALGLLSSIPQMQDIQKHKIYAFTLLGIAFSASIGGMGTIIGTPPNAIVATQLGISFSEWLWYGIPIVLIFWPIMICILWCVFRPKLNMLFSLDLENKSLNPQQWMTLVLFICIALSWIFSKTINEGLSALIGLDAKISSFDSIIALSAIVIICISNIANWKEIQKNTDWGILILFGGGITLSVLLKDSGASKVMADLVVSLIQDGHLFLIGLAVAFFIVFLTEVTSNTASAALLVPLFVSIADSLSVPSLGLALIVGFGASCAFMLPVATPPNAIVFGSGHIRQGDMMRVGLILNIVCASILATIGYVFWL